MPAVDITVCDCSYHEEHAEFHVMHPMGHRLVCSICHPAPRGAEKVSKAMQRFIDSGGHHES